MCLYFFFFTFIYIYLYNIRWKKNLQGVHDLATLLQIDW